MKRNQRWGMRKQTRHGSIYTLWYGVLHLCLLSDNSRQVHHFLTPPPSPLVVQVSILRGTNAESVPPEYTQLEGMCSAFSHANIHNGMKILLSGVSLLNPAWYRGRNGCRLWTATPDVVGGNSLPVAPNDKINPDAGAGSIRSTVNIRICSKM